LFQSLTKADFARLDAQKGAKERPGKEEAAIGPDDPDPEDELEGAALVIAGTDELPEDMEVGIAGAEDQEEESGEEPVMRASFIGEFFPESEDEATEEEFLHETAMR
jgi:hypothetical protein